MRQPSLGSHEWIHETEEKDAKKQGTDEAKKVKKKKKKGRGKK
jgi:hypothetical protein